MWFAPAPFLRKRWRIDPNLARTNFFYGSLMKRRAITTRPPRICKSSWRNIRATVWRSTIWAASYFCRAKYADAVKVLQQVLAVDPEDLQAHYNLMLCYNGLGDEKMSKEHQARYLRFKADEASQAITGPYRQLNPEDNNERQNIHEHMSVPLPILTNQPDGSLHRTSPLGRQRSEVRQQSAPPISGAQK